MATQQNIPNLDFQKFYLRLTQINVKLRLNKPLDHNQQQEYEVLKYLISAFNKIKQNSHEITLDDVIDGIAGTKQAKDDVTKEAISPELEIDTTQYMFNDSIFTAHNQTSAYLAEEKEFSSDNDEEGDILVEALTEDCLKRYYEVRKKALISCETDEELQSCGSDSGSTYSSTESDTCLYNYDTCSDGDNNDEFWEVPTNEKNNSSDDNDLPLSFNISDLCFS